MDRPYCIDCDVKLDSYIVELRPSTFAAKGEEIPYTEKVARCPLCHNEIYVASVNDDNCDAKEMAFDEKFSAKSLELKRVKVELNEELA